MSEFNWVSIVIFQDNKALMGQRIKDGVIVGFQFPGGHVELGESNINAAIREAFEETGLEIAIDSILVTKNSRPSLKKPPEEGKNYALQFFAAHVVGGKLENKEPDKCDGWDWYDVKNLPEPLFGQGKAISDKLYYYEHRHGWEINA